MLCVNNPVVVKRGQDSLGVFCFWTDASFMSDADRRRSFLAPFTACVCDRWRKQGSLMVLRSVTVWIYHQGAEKKKRYQCTVVCKDQPFERHLCLPLISVVMWLFHLLAKGILHCSLAFLFSNYYLSSKIYKEFLLKYYWPRSCIDYICSFSMSGYWTVKYLFAMALDCITVQTHTEKNLANIQPLLSVGLVSSLCACFPKAKN